MSIQRNFSIVFYLSTIAALVTCIDTARGLGPYDARSGDECRAQFNAAFDAKEAKMRSEGNYRGIAVTEDERPSYLAQCKALDRILQNERLSPAFSRLSVLLEALRKGHSPSGAETYAVQADYAAILKIPPENPNRGYYLSQYANYQRYLSLLRPDKAAATVIYRCTSQSMEVSFSDHPCATGSHAQTQQVVLKSVPAQSCANLRRHISESSRDYDHAVDALLAGAKNSDDSWRQVEAQRQHAFSEQRWYVDRARLQGCRLP